MVIRQIVKYLEKNNLNGNTFEIVNFLKKNKSLESISKKNKKKFLEYRTDLF